MTRILFTILLTLAFLPALIGQTGGEGIYNFLQLTNAAKSAALGGIQVAIPDPDPELLMQNPALLSPEMNNAWSVNYSRYMAGIGFGSGSYAKDLGRYGRIAVGIRFVDYGQFVAADEVGLITGNFTAADYALNLTYAKKIGNLFTLGTSLKPIYSHLENYRSYGIAADIGIARISADKLTSMAMCIKDIGTQIKSYYEGGPHEKLVWSLQVGITHQLQHAPFRLSITAYDLNSWNSEIAVIDPNGISSVGTNSFHFSDLMRHLAMGAEIFPENKLTFRLGYNYRRATDLGVPHQSLFSGFTSGLGIRLSTIHFNYAISEYSYSGLIHNFSITANLSRSTQ